MPPLSIHVPQPPPPAASGVLRVRGNKIVDKNDQEIILKGAAIGGHLNMENFITGYPGHETGMRKALKNALGEEKYDFFFHKFLEYFFAEKDAAFFASLGLNCLRVPFNYRHFEDDMNPGTYKEQGFQWLDRIINICANHGIYTILDLHAAPGGQNISWHSDNSTHRALFFDHIEFQNRAIALWVEIAKRYKGNTWVAGYNPLNEPSDSEHVRLLSWYARVEKAIREVDDEHILYWDGNTFALFQAPLPNSVYACHDYASYGFPAGEPYTGSADQRAHLEKTFERKVEYQRRHDVPIWNGEFGPVYASPTDGPEWEKINARRYHLLQDQLKIYEKSRIHWSIWLYKDIGFQGMVHASPESPYIQLLQSFLAKKKRLAADKWGADASHLKYIFEPLEAWLVREAPAIKHEYPPTWTPLAHIERLIRNILLSEELYPEYASYFVGLSTSQLDELAGSFKFENCEQRTELNRVLREHAERER
ncbi:glycoside hydrolase family 5 protein [Botryobasidium botryosum FD-172 SS1]|uniref:Glycoside hydrolase family 5 protein n=1 Tax=Botryobasidium botryosum (strain FD-172 SS1) TaxID=930990 RepID=A0A067MVR3_BOTB1|nr:glycoside hydrolase family 5 protein [Botryobasidium botryosum FD-172 SS1]